MTLSSPMHLSEGRDETRKHCHLFCFLGKNRVFLIFKKNSASHSMVMKMLILMVAMLMMMFMMTNYFLTYDLSLTFVSRLEGKPSSTAHSANTLMCTLNYLIYITICNIYYFNVYIYIYITYSANILM